MRPNQHAKLQRQRHLDNLREAGHTDVADLGPLIAQIIAECHVITLKAHRLARGWTVQQAVDAIHQLCRVHDRGSCNMSREQLSHFEAGTRPGERYRDLLCCLYQTGPVQMGWAFDYSTGDADSANTRPSLTLGQMLPSQRTPRGASLLDEAHLEEAAMRRRDALRAILLSASSSAMVLPIPLLDEIEHLRSHMDAHLNTSTVSAATLDRWGEITQGHGFAFKNRPPRELLTEVLLDIAELQHHAARRQTTDHQKRLCRASAQLAGLAANILTDLGHHRHARNWWGTAQTAADETGDRALTAWVRVREATVSLYHHRPAQTAIALATEAQQRAGRTPCAGAALAAATEARAWARLGAASRALDALKRAESIADQLSGHDLANSIYGYPTQQLAFHRAATLTTVGTIVQARRAQQQALNGYPPGEYINPSLIHLDEAACHLRAHDVNTALQLATNSLYAIPAAYRTPLVLSRAHELGDLAAATPRTTQIVRTYREALNTIAPPD